MAVSGFPPDLWTHLAAMSPGRSFGAFFEAVADPTTPPGRLGQLLDANPGTLHLVQQVEAFQARRKRWDEEAAEDAPKDGKPVKPEAFSGEALISTLGKFALRDILACIRFHRVADVGLPRKPADRFSPPVRDLLKKALLAEAFCEDHRMANPEFAYAAGLLYDGLNFRLTQVKGAPKDVKAQADAAWSEGFLIAQIAYGLASHMGKLSLSPYAFGAGLVLPLGKAWMAWFYPEPADPIPSWKDFVAECDAYGVWSRTAMLLLEKKRFPVTHSEVSALFASALGVLGPASAAIGSYAEPELIRGVAPKAHHLAIVLKAASILARGGLSGGLEGAFARCTAGEAQFVRALKVPNATLQSILKKAKPA